MRIAALIVGIIGGLIALVIGQMGFALGSLIGYPQLKALSIILPIIALLGAGIVMPMPLIGAALMALAGIVFIIILGFNFFTFIPVLLLFLAAILGFAGQGENGKETISTSANRSEIPTAPQTTTTIPSAPQTTTTTIPSTSKPITPELLARQHIFEAKIAKEPDVVAHLISYGDYLLSESLTDDATVQYIRAMDVVPNDEEIGLRLVRAYHMGKHYDKAITNALILLDSHPDNLPIFDELASVYIELSKFPEAAQVFLQMTTIEPSNREHLVRRLDMVRKIPNRHDEILEICHVLHKAEPFQYPACNFYIGMSIAGSSHDGDTEQLSQAEKMLSDALSKPDALSPEERISCQLFLIKTQLRLKKDSPLLLDDLRSITSKSLSSSQQVDLAECFLILGKVKFEAGLTDAAIESYIKSLQIKDSEDVRHNLAEAYKQRGQFLLKSGDFGSATKQFSTALEHKKDDSEIRALFDTAVARRNKKISIIVGIVSASVVILVAAILVFSSHYAREMPLIAKGGGGITIPKRADNQYTPPQNAPPPSQNKVKPYNRTDYMKSFITDYIKANEDKNIDGVLWFYGDTVDYYAKGIVSKSYIYKDKGTFFRSWNTLSYSLVDDLLIMSADGPNRITLVFTFTYVIEMSKKIITATAKNTWVIDNPDIRPKIVSEKQVTYDRRESFKSGGGLQR